MFMRRINGWNPIHRLQEEMDRLFEDFSADPLLRGSFSFGTARVFPAINVWEDAENLYAEAELPGLKMDDLELLVVGNELTLKGQRPEGDRENASFHRRERGAGTFSRVVRLPVDINADKVEAVLKNGVLTITMPKAEEARPRKVEVKALTK